MSTLTPEQQLKKRRRSYHQLPGQIAKFIKSDGTLTEGMPVSLVPDSEGNTGVFDSESENFEAYNKGNLFRALIPIAGAVGTTDIGVEVPENKTFKMKLSTLQGTIIGSNNEAIATITSLKSDVPVEYIGGTTVPSTNPNSLIGNGSAITIKKGVTILNDPTFLIIPLNTILVGSTAQTNGKDKDTVKGNLFTIGEGKYIIRAKIINADFSTIDYRLEFIEKDISEN